MPVAVRLALAALLLLVLTTGAKAQYQLDPGTCTAGTAQRWNGTAWSCETLAPLSAPYWTSTANATLTGETDLGALTTGLILGTVSGGVSTPSAYAGTSCTNQFPRSLNASGSATCASVAGSDFATQAANLIFGGPASGPAAAPTFRALVTADLADNSVTDGKLRDSGALSVIGRSANSSGDSADISATATSDAVLRESGSTIGFGTVATGGLANNAVTNAKLAQMAANTVKANATAGTADPADLAVGTNTVVGRAAGNMVAAQVATGQIAANAVDNTIGADMAQATIKGRAVGAGTGDPTDLTAAQATAILDTFTSTLKGLAPSSGGGTTNFLRADGTWAAPGGGSDPWTYLQVNAGSDFTTTSATAVDVTGLTLTPSANTSYEIECRLGIRTAATATNPRVGFAWSTGLTDGFAMIEEAQAAGTAPFAANGNINAALLIAAGGLPNTTQSWPVRIFAAFRAGASPSGATRVQLASETAGTTVRIVTAGSFCRWRTHGF